mgnify:CR=1 FL=1
MSDISELDLQNLRHLIGGFDTTHCKMQEYAKEEKAKIAELKAKIEDTPIDEREGIFNQIDKLEQEALDKYEVFTVGGGTHE